ncbi:MAG TPA: VWA domain-containing protein [Phycisphaerae bacterium]|nr:VWA domain-containing protein [Phycisphaerae bacterium]
MAVLAMRLGPLDFAQPLWLLGLLLLAPIFYWWKTSRVAGSPIRRSVALALRSLLILALVLALAGTRVVWFTKGICVVFVLDQSQSVPGAARDVARERIQNEIQKMTDDDQFVVVEFAGDAILESVPSPKGPMPPASKVADPGRTDIARALRLAMASFPPDRQKRIVLFSDGNQNNGDALKEARIAAANFVDVDVLLISAPPGHEVMVDQLVVPPHVRKDAQFVVRALVNSDTAQTAQLVVTRDGSLLDPITVQLKPGANVIDIPQDGLSDGGFHQFQVTVQPQRPDDDTFAANNTGYAFTQVDAPGKVLLVEENPRGDHLYDALRQAGIAVQEGGVGALPSTVKDFGPYDCVILDNVNRFNLSTIQMTELERWVKEMGGGLVLVGGDNSFGPGGYKGTPLEDVAPVDMDVKREKHLASLAIVVVLDKSGSMGAPANASGIEKMRLADEGAVEVLKLLDPSDSAMIGAVDTEVQWVGPAKLLPMTPSNKSKLIDDTRTVVSGGGGIYCETALAHAYDLINAPGVDAMAKHVIMFADTQDSEQQEACVQMARDNFNRHGVTTSVIGLGDKLDSDSPFQQEVAKAGHGRWDASSDAMALPRLFAKEAFLVSRQAFVEKKEGITPTLYPSPLLEGFETAGGGVPKVYGYVGTTLKPRATMAMHGLEPDDPLLAHWSIGLGKCVAYMSDTGDRWGRDWAAWNGYSKFWAQVVRWVSRGTVSNGVATSTVIDGSDGHIIVDANDSNGRPINNLQLKADVISPDQTAATKNVPLEQIGPGRYQGRFTASQRGTYLVSVADAKSNDPVGVGGGVLSYPPEYRDLKPNAALMTAMADATGGKQLSNLDGVFAPKPDPVRTFWPLWETLLVLIASGLLADVAWRRLNLIDWLRPRRPAGIPVLQTPSQAATVGAWRSVKTARRDVETQRETLREKVEARAAAMPASTDHQPSGATAIAEATTPAKSPKPGVSEGYANRLLDAKRRAADQIREQSDTPPQ